MVIRFRIRNAKIMPAMSIRLVRAAVYDEAKRYAEALVMAYHREHGMDTRHRAHIQYLWSAHAP